MTLSRGHLDALRAKHSALDRMIQEEERHPSMSSARLRQLKVRKLRLKEEIEQQRHRA